MPPGCLFISYRRDDSAGYARALHEALAAVYGHERVFIDVDDIGAGQRFADVIAQALDSAAVLLVLIGPRWSGAREGAPARLWDAHDFVRREVEAGLAQRLHVVPVLLDGTPMPRAADLPDSLHPLLEHHALTLGSQGFQSDLAQLMTALEPHLGAANRSSAAPGPPSFPPQPPAEHAGRRGLLWGAAAMGLAAASASAWWWSRRGPQAADFVGAWAAEVTYPWPNAVYTERIDLHPDGDTLAGSASFLRVPRVIGQVRLDAQGLHFSTRTRSEGGVDRWEDLHRYRLQRLPGGGLQVEMQTESRGVARPPLRFHAQPVKAAEPTSTR